MISVLVRAPFSWNSSVSLCLFEWTTCKLAPYIQIYNVTAKIILSLNCLNSLTRAGIMFNDGFYRDQDSTKRKHLED